MRTMADVVSLFAKNGLMTSPHSEIGRFLMGTQKTSALTESTTKKDTHQKTAAGRHLMNKCTTGDVTIPEMTIAVSTRKGGGGVVIYFWTLPLTRGVLRAARRSLLAPFAAGQPVFYDT